MADHFFGVNRGIIRKVSPNVTTGASTGSTDIEVRVGDGFGWTKHEVAAALEAIKNYIIVKSTFPVK